MFRIANYFNVPDSKETPKHFGGVKVGIGEQGEFCQCCLEKLEADNIQLPYEEKNTIMNKFKRNSGKNKVLIAVSRNSYICTDCLSSILVFAKIEDENLKPIREKNNEA